jgi:hypothetical protein
MNKICKVCGRELPLSAFKKHRLSKDGYTAYCKTCASHKREAKIDFASTMGGGNPALKDFTPRELIEELKARGYKGKLTIEREIIL